MNTLSKLRHMFRTTALRSAFRWSRSAHRKVLAITLLGILGTLLSLMLPLTTRSLIDAATASEPEPMWRSAVLLVVLIAAGRALGVLTASIRVRANAELRMEMQRMVTESLLEKEYAAIKPFHSGELMSRVYSDVAVVRNGVISILPNLVQTGVSFLGAAVILTSMDWRFVPVLIVASLGGMGMMLLFRQPMKKRHKRMQEAEDALHASTQETLENIRVIKASVSEERAIARMALDQKRLRTEQMRNENLHIALNSGMGVVFDISWLICNIWGCVKIFHKQFTYGSLAALIQLIGRIQQPIANAANIVGQIYGVVASAERLQDILDLPPEEKEEPLHSFDEIRLENVSFQYADSTDEVLIGVNSVIRRGEFVALTGVSGGGKTSLFQLLLGIYRPTGGQVLFVTGGHARRAGRGTRSLFAYVPQGNTLFSGTLRDNLTRFTDSATDEEITEAARVACIDGLVAEIGLDAVIGERGVGLSEGQAQRVAIARALLSGAPILLLDEATSALDEATEARLLQNIAGLKQQGGKTCVIVTHRPAALQICGSRLEIADGRVRRIEGNKA